MFNKFFLPITYLFSAETFPNFFISPIGILTILLSIFLLTLLFVKLLKKKKVFSIKALTYSAICIALSTVLSLYTFMTMPQGGSVTFCSLLFISLIGYWFGCSAGFVAGFVCGTVQLLFGAYIIHPIQLLLDYPIAFSLLGGLSGVFRDSKNGLYKGYILGCFGKFLASLISGVIFFSETTNSIPVSIWISGVYNISYLLPEMAITLVLISIPSFKNAINIVFGNSRASERTVGKTF